MVNAGSEKGDGGHDFLDECQRMVATMSPKRQKREVRKSGIGWWSRRGETMEEEG